MFCRRDPSPVTHCTQQPLENLPTASSQLCYAGTSQGKLSSSADHKLIKDGSVLWSAEIDTSKAFWSVCQCCWHPHLAGMEAGICFQLPVQGIGGAHPSWGEAGSISFLFEAPRATSRPQYVPGYLFRAQKWLVGTEAPHLQCITVSAAVPGLCGVRMAIKFWWSSSDRLGQAQLERKT